MCLNYFLIGDNDVSFQNVTHPSPVLVGEEDGFQLYINGDPIFLSKMTKFSSSCEALFQSYWVFALEYPKQMQKTLLFLEKYIFKSTTCTVPATVASWAKKLNLYL